MRSHLPFTDSSPHARPGATSGQAPETPFVELRWAKRKTAEQHLLEAEAAFASARVSLVAAMEELVSSDDGELQRVGCAAGDVVGTAEVGLLAASAVRRGLEQLRQPVVAADGVPSCRG